MHELSDLLKSVSRVSLLGGSHLHVHFNQGTPTETIEAFLLNLDLQVPGVSLTYPMINLESQTFKEHLAITLANPPPKKIKEVFIFEKHGMEKKGKFFPLSEITH